MKNRSFTFSNFVLFVLICTLAPPLVFAEDDAGDDELPDCVSTWTTSSVSVGPVTVSGNMMAGGGSKVDAAMAKLETLLKAASGPLYEWAGAQTCETGCIKTSSSATHYTVSLSGGDDVSTPNCSQEGVAWATGKGKGLSCTQAIGFAAHNLVNDALGQAETFCKGFGSECSPASFSGDESDLSTYAIVDDSGVLCKAALSGTAYYSCTSGETSIRQGGQMSAEKVMTVECAYTDPNGEPEEKDEAQPLGNGPHP